MAVIAVLLQNNIYFILNKKKDAWKEIFNISGKRLQNQHLTKYLGKKASWFDIYKYDKLDV